MQQSLIPGPRKFEWDDSGRQFRWKTMDGQVLTLAEMQTSHIFNSMKMIFNHIAEHFKDATPVWFEHRYGAYVVGCKEFPTTFAVQVLFFIREIERRGDLPPKYWEPYQQILAQIRPLALSSGFLLPAPGSQDEAQQPALDGQRASNGTRLLSSPASDPEL